MKPENSTKVYRRLLSVVKQFWPAFVLGIIATIIVSGVDAGFTWLIKPIINQGFIHRHASFIKLLPLILIGAFVIRTLANIASNYLVSRVARSVVMMLRQQVFSHLLGLPASFYDKRATGQLLSVIVYNIDQVADASSDTLIRFLREGALLIGMLLVMLSLSWQLTVFIALISPLMFFLIKICSKRLRRLGSSVQDSVAEVTNIAQEAINGYQVIRLNNKQQHEFNKFEQATLRNRARELKMVVTNQINVATVQLLIAVPAIAFISLATTNYVHISAGGFTALITALFGLLRPARQLGKLNNQIQKGIAGAESVFQLTDLALETDSVKSTLATPVRGAIEFKQVSFCYPETDKKVLQDVSFELAPGKMLAIVGHSGAGKSTLMQLLPRFYSNIQGEILLDGVNIHDLSLAELRAQLAFVTQKTELFNDTVAANIAYGVAECDQDAIVAAAKAAHAFEFIEKLPQGFDTMIGEDGIMLSGGQRQRLAIARAIIKPAPILLLDEATSALDTQSEQFIQQAINELAKTRTIMVIAHRLSTVEKADQILVMDQGQVIEVGNHQDLLAKNGAYAELYRIQFSGS